MRFSSRLLKDWLRASALGVFGYGAALLPLKRNKIVFCSYYGKGFGDNGRYLVDEIQRQNLEVDIVWLLSKSLMPNAVLPEGVRRVMYGSLRSAFELATAGIWVDNSRKFIAPPKRRGQFYIQTWHGGLGVKCVEQAAQDKLTQTYVRLAKRDAQMTDLMVSNGGYITRVFNTNFWYSGPILEKGFPRNDILFRNDPTLRDQVRRRLGLAPGVKVMLYAPSFRNEASAEDYLFDADALRQALEQRFGGSWLLLFRLHPNVAHLASQMPWSETLRDGSSYEDMQELLLVSDAFSTDFSSCLSDFFILKRPVFLFCRDYTKYLNERGFNLDIKSLGFPLAESEDELLANIRNFDPAACLAAIEANIQRLGFVDGSNASSSVVEEMKRICGLLPRA